MLAMYFRLSLLLIASRLIAARCLCQTYSNDAMVPFILMTSLRRDVAPNPSVFDVYT